MLHIDQDTIRIGVIADEWATRLESFITEVGHDYSVSYPNPSNPKETIDESCDTYKAKMLATVAHSNLTAGDKAIAKGYIVQFCQHVPYYAKAKERDMKHIHIMCGLIEKNHVQVYKQLAVVFIQLYKDFVKYKPTGLSVPIAYYFIDKLNVRTCPYCNRIYAFNIYDENGKKARPEYDHFYDKSSNPLLAVSFYNLVPSCPICNHIKLTDTLHINPFFRRFKGVFRVYEKEDGAKQLKHESPQPLTPVQLFNRSEWGDLRLDTDSKDELEDLHTLGLDEFYKHHDDYVEEIVEKAQAYSGPMLAALSSTFQGAGYSPKQVFDFAWGKDIETARNINRPLSKLTRDILEQVGII